MKIETTYQELNGMVLEIQSFQQSGFPTVGKLVEHKLKRFLERNRSIIEHLSQTTQKLFADHVERNDKEEEQTKGTYKFAKTVTEMGEMMMPVFIDNDHAKLYQQGWAKLMEAKCTIIL